jgi:hypothetical protein
MQMTSSARFLISLRAASCLRDLRERAVVGHERFLWFWDHHLTPLWVGSNPWHLPFSSICCPQYAVSMKYMALGLFADALTCILASIQLERGDGHAVKLGYKTDAQKVRAFRTLLGPSCASCSLF